MYAFLTILHVSYIMVKTQPSPDAKDKRMNKLAKFDDNSKITSAYLRGPRLFACWLHRYQSLAVA